MKDETSRQIQVRYAHRGFLWGIGYAVSYLVELRDEPFLAAELIHESGYKLEDFKKAELDNYDMRAMKKVFREERIQRNKGAKKEDREE